MLLDFVVVSFAGEYSSLLLQARSMCRFNDPSLIGRYHIIWNDTHSHESFDTLFRPRLQAEFEGSGVDWNVILRSEILDISFLDRYGKNGDRVQQLLKLLSARLCTTDSICILDSKNHIVRSLSADDFMADGALLRCHSQSYPPESPFNPWFRAALGYFGVDDTDRKVSALPALPSTTPYVMSRAVILDMLDTVERTEAQPFDKVFMEHEVISRSTEFLLYCAFVISRFQDVRRLYKLSRRNYVTFFNKSPDGDEAIRIAIQETKRPDIKFVGFHRRRRLRLTAPEKEAFVGLWMSSGLFASEGAANNFLANDAI